ncbi:hypothetical protein HY633_03510 [Candidatus Uhrbacteria bacterium]|nr:hypothetical protein [Candidatus Uhrbacteria bacterium]
MTEARRLKSDRTKADEKIAKGCDVTVVTAADPLIHHRNVIPAAIKQAFGADSRYDLLSFPDFPAAFDDGAVAQLAHDVETAISLHRVEKVLVLEPDGKGQPYAALLAHHFRGTKVEVKSAPTFVGERRSYRTLVVTCMDWRLHGEGGFLTRCLRSMPEEYGIMTVPGVVKDLAAGDKFRSRWVRGQILNGVLNRGVERIMLVSHTDCGKYGGSAAFRHNYLDEIQALREDLRLAVRLAADHRDGSTFSLPANVSLETAIASLQIDALCTVF